MVSYAVHYELSRNHHQETLLTDFGRMRLDMTKEQPQVLYVAMATWLPKCNMVSYQQQINCDEDEVPTSDRLEDAAALTHEQSAVKPAHDVKSMEVVNEDPGDCVIVENNENDGHGTGLLVTNSPQANSSRSPSEVNENNTEVIEEAETIGVQVDNETTPKKDTLGHSDADSLQMEVIYDKKAKLSTPKKPLTPKQLQKKLESEKKKQQKQREREEREKQRNEEKAKILTEKNKIKEQKDAEKQKQLDEKQKQLELKHKEKEMKEEQKKREKEEKEQKRKEREEQEAQKRKEKEQEKLRKQQEIEEKNKEKQKEEEKKQKSAALFVNFFKKTENEEKEKKAEKINCNFKPFEVKSDMRLPPVRRQLLSADETEGLEYAIQHQSDISCYLKDLRDGKITPRKSTKTWPYEDIEEEVTIIEEDKNLGETICENTSIRHKMKAKFLFFHENRRPAYFGTWRKRSKFVKPRKPFGQDTVYFNYEEDSDDDWEEEEQGESLDISGDDEEKNSDVGEDDYEVDNEFFVPHGHLSDDEIDDEENARLSPESLKTKLKLLKDEFDHDMKSKTAKLKPRCIGGVWLDVHGDYVDEAIYRYLQPFAMIVAGPVEIRKRIDFSPLAKPEKKKVKALAELPLEQIPFFLGIIHRNVNKKKTIIEEFLRFMSNNGHSVDVSKTSLNRFLKDSATYKKCTDDGSMKNKFGWFVNDDVLAKYNVSLDLNKANI